MVSAVTAHVKELHILVTGVRCFSHLSTGYFKVQYKTKKKKNTNPRLLDANPRLSTETRGWCLRSHRCRHVGEGLLDHEQHLNQQLFREQIICITTRPAGRVSAANDAITPHHSKPLRERSFCFSQNINKYHP